MKNRNRLSLWLGMTFLAAFVLWTVLVVSVDVRPIGPEGSSVGFAALNGSVHEAIGVHWSLYTITDWLGLVPIGVAFGFAVLGLVQLLQRKSLRKVDRSLLVLGGFYIVVMGLYLLFETVTVNRRPVLIDGILETSYPSSTTLLALCVLSTAMMQLRSRIRRKSVRIVILGLFAALTAFMVIGRLLSGVHWLTDIIGGLLLGAGLVSLYAFAARDPGADNDGRTAGAEP